MDAIQKENEAADLLDRIIEALRRRDSLSAQAQAQQLLADALTEKLKRLEATK